MSRDELVQGYLGGQLSRRVFVRRLIASGVSAMAALAYVDILRRAPAEAAIGPDFYLRVEDFAFYGGAIARLDRGQRVEFAFASVGLFFHSATDTSPLKLFDTDQVSPQGVAFVDRFVAAGTYPYRCKESTGTHQEMKGTIKVPITVAPAQGPLGDAFTITWASSTLNRYVFDVQRKKPGEASFSLWKDGVTSLGSSFTPQQKGTFRFRARLHRVSNDATSGWSATKTLQVT